MAYSYTCDTEWWSVVESNADSIGRPMRKASYSMVRSQ